MVAVNGGVGMQTSMVGVKEGEAYAWERRVSACSTSPGYHPVTLPKSGARPKADLCASGAKKRHLTSSFGVQTKRSRRSSQLTPRLSPLATHPKRAPQPQGVSWQAFAWVEIMT